MLSDFEHRKFCTDCVIFDLEVLQNFPYRYLLRNWADYRRIYLVCPSLPYPKILLCVTLGSFILELLFRTNADNSLTIWYKTNGLFLNSLKNLELNENIFTAVLHGMAVMCF